MEIVYEDPNEKRTKIQQVNAFLRSDYVKQYYLTIYDRMMLMALASYIHKKKRCYPKMKTICDFASMSDKEARRALKRLESAELIQIERRKGTFSFYKITVPYVHDDVIYAPKSVDKDVDD